MERWTFRVYVTDTLQTIVENTSIPAAYFTDGKAGKTMSRRWAEKDRQEPPEETRTPEEVTKYMLQKLRGGNADGSI